MTELLLHINNYSITGAITTYQTYRYFFWLVTLTQAEITFAVPPVIGFPYSFLTFWKKKKKRKKRRSNVNHVSFWIWASLSFAHIIRGLLSLLYAFLRNLVGFFFLLLNNIFGTVYLISFNLFILYTVLYIYIYIYIFFLIYVFVQLMFLIKIS